MPRNALTIPLLGFVPRAEPAFHGEHASGLTFEGWRPAARAAFEEGRLLGIQTLIADSSQDSYVLDSIAFAVPGPDGPVWVETAEGILAHGGTELLALAFAIAQGPTPYFPPAALMRAWYAHKPDGDSITYARVFSHPDGWVIGSDDPSIEWEEGLELVRDVMSCDPDDEEGDLSVVEDECGSGTYAACVLAMPSLTVSAHQQLDAQVQGRRLFAAWQAACPDWAGLKGFDIEEKVPMRLADTISVH